MKRFAVLIMLAMWATGCATGPGPREVMGRYLDAYGNGKNEEAYSLLSSSDKTAKSLDAFSESEGSDFKAILGPKISYQVKEVTTEGDKAKAAVEVTTPDIKGVFGEFFGAIMSMYLEGNRTRMLLRRCSLKRCRVRIGRLLQVLNITTS